MKAKTVGRALTTPLVRAATRLLPSNTPAKNSEERRLDGLPPLRRQPNRLRDLSEPVSGERGLAVPQRPSPNGSRLSVAVTLAPSPDYEEVIHLHRHREHGDLKLSIKKPLDSTDLEVHAQLWPRDDAAPPFDFSHHAQFDSASLTPEGGASTLTLFDLDLPPQQRNKGIESAYARAVTKAAIELDVKALAIGSRVQGSAIDKAVQNANMPVDEDGTPQASPVEWLKHFTQDDGWK